MNLFANYSIVNNICIGVLCFFIFLNKGHIFKNKATGGTNFFFLWLLATLFSTFYMPVNGDVYNGYQSYYDYLATGNQYHMEPFYFWLIDHLPQNYYLYRFVIWGTASLFLVLTFKKLNCQSQLATLVFISSCLIVCYYYLRNVLGFSILYYVVASLFSPHQQSKAKRYGFYILYAALLVATYFLHRSMPLYYAVVLLAIFLPSNKYAIILLALLFPTISFVVPSLVGTVMNLGILNQETAELAASYIEYSEGFDFNFMGRVLRFFWLVPYVIIMIVAILKLPKKIVNKKRPIEVFLLTSLFLFSFSFIFANQFSNSLHLRILNTSFLPMSYFITMYLEDKRDKKIGHIFSLFLIAYYGMIVAGRLI